MLLKAGCQFARASESGARNQPRHQAAGHAVRVRARVSRHEQTAGQDEGHRDSAGGTTGI